MRYNELVVKVVPLVLVILAIIGGILLWQGGQREEMVGKQQSVTQETNTSTKEIHLHAAFIIFTNGTKRIFTDSKYRERIPETHLHRSNSSVIHIHARDITWQQFFDSLPVPMKVTTDCLTTGTGQKFCTEKESSLKFYLNGQKKESLFLNQEIRDSDMLLISYGSENENQLQSQANQIPNPRLLNLNPEE